MPVLPPCVMNLIRFNTGIDQISDKTTVQFIFVGSDNTTRIIARVNDTVDAIGNRNAANGGLITPKELRMILF